MDMIFQYAIILPLVFLAGFVDAVAGGGGLISLPAYFIAGLPVHNAIGTNKMSAAMGTLLATGKFARSGFILWRLALPAVLFAFAGSALGAHLMLWVDPDLFMKCLLVIIPLTAFYVLRQRHTEEKPRFSEIKTLILTCAAAFVIGIYDGFYGPGTGTFLILILTGAAHLHLKEANGVTKVINSATNVSALAVFLLNGTVLFPMGLIAGVFGMAGNWLGANYFSGGDPKKVRPVIIFVLVIFFVKVVYDLFLK